MANFTDTILNHTPYVQQLPIDAMVAVGSQKQLQYNQGVERIQSHIDNVAGMDVYRDADKQYLQSRLNQLGGDLKKVAAGDFSNYQLQNSVGGMIGKISKDPTIRTALSSTIQLREQEKRMQEDLDKGVSNPNNVAKFYKDIRGWSESSTPGEKLPSTYFKPIDIWAKIKDIAKEVGLDETTVQQLYKTDDFGNIEYETDRDGNKSAKWNPIMVEKHLKGKDAGKILSAFQTALTAADYKQLAIDGEMGKAHYTPDMLKEEIRVKSYSHLKVASDKLDGLKIALHNEKSKNKKDETRIKSLSDQIEYFQKYEQSLRDGINRNLSLVDSNPDAVRASLYTNDYLHKMSTALSSQEESTKYSENPLQRMSIEQNRLNRDIQRDKIADYHWKVEQERKDKEEARQELELSLKYKLKRTKDGFVTEGTPQPIETEGKEYSIKRQVEEDYDTTLSSINDINYQLTAKYFKRINPDKTSDEIARLIEEKALKGDPELGLAPSAVQAASGVINEYTSRMALKQLDEWRKGKGIPPEFESLVKNQERLIKSSHFQKNQMERIREEAQVEAERKGIDTKSIDKIKQSISPVNINVDGRNVHISKEDVIDFSNIVSREFSPIGHQLLSKMERSLSDQAEIRMRAKYGDNFNKVFNSLVKTIPPTGMSVLFTQPAVPATSLVHPSIRKAREMTAQYRASELAEIEGELYAKSGLIKQSVGYPVLRGDETADDFASRVMNVVAAYEVNEAVGFNKDDVKKALLSGDDKALRVMQHPPSSIYSSPTYELQVVTEEGVEPVMINESELRQLNIIPEQLSDIPEEIQILNNSPTTNMAGSNNPGGAWWGSSEFTGILNEDYKVMGDLVRDEGDPNFAWMKLYIFEKGILTDTLTHPDRSKGPIPLYDDQRRPNTNIPYLPQAISNTTIQALKKTK